MKIRRGTWLLLVLLGVAAGAGALLLRRPSLPPPPTAERLAALRTERDALRDRFRSIVAAQGEKSLGEAPRAGVMIGLPTSLTARVLEQVVTGLFGETTLTLRNLKVHKEGAVKAKMLLRKKKLGEYVLDVHIKEVQGVLKPGKPRLGFGRNAVDITLPVSVASGRGEADLRIQWDSKGLAANAVCGDADVTRTVTGGVIPQDYEVQGRFAITAFGEMIVLRPSFPDLAVRIFVDPSDEAWSVVDSVVEERNAVCEAALKKVDIKEKLGAIVGKGFNVKIPQKIFKPILLPAGVRQSLEVQGIELALHAKPTGVLVAKDRIWYGADLNFGAGALAPPPRPRPAAPRPTPRPAPRAPAQ
jgi:hypothetical protein